jgi:hypothetical protein
MMSTCANHINCHSKGSYGVAIDLKIENDWLQWKVGFLTKIQETKKGEWPIDIIEMKDRNIWKRGRIQCHNGAIWKTYVHDFMWLGENFSQEHCSSYTLRKSFTNGQ